MSVNQTKLAEILGLKGVDIPTDFVWGGHVQNLTCSLKKLQVDDNNEYSTSLTLKDVNTLKEAGTFVAATHTWEFDVDQISIPQPQFSALTSMLVDKLGFHPDDLDITFYQTILCGAEGKIPKNDAERKTDKFATMVVQIPVEGGFLGGRLHVHRQRQSTSFDFASNSHDTFYAAIFYADSRHEMKQIKSGWRLIMVFDVSWKTSLKNISSFKELLTFCKTLKKLRDVLEPWEQSDKPRLLAVPLKQKLSKSDLSFSALKDRDLWMANLFRSINWLDVHLTLLVKRQQWIREECDCYGHNDFYRYKQRYYEDYECENDHETEFLETYGTDKLWMGVNNKPICFEKLEINTGNELMGAVDKLFCGEPDELRYKDDTDDDSEDNLTDCLYYWAVLVVWPKKNSLDMALQFGFDGVFDLLERLAENSATSEEAVDTLNQVLAYCQEHPGHLWSKNSWQCYGVPKNYSRRIERLLKICLRFDTKRKSLEVLNLVATEFRLATNGVSYTSTVGVLSNVTAECIAELVSVHGWEYYSDVVYRLLSPKVKNQIEQNVHLIFCLLDRQCVEAAVHCARRVVSWILSPESGIDQLNGTDLLACVSAILKLDENPSTSQLAATENLIGKLHVLKTETLCELIIKMGACDGSLVKPVPKSLEFYRRLCDHLLTRDFNSLGGLNRQNGSTLELLKCFLWLADFNLLQLFTEKLLKDRNKIIKSIVLSNDVKAAFVSTSKGKRLFEKLVDFQIAEFESKRTEPKFTWEQPGAVFAPHHPSVQEFLRSSSQSITYVNFNGIAHARNFARKYFGRDSIANGYSAAAQTGGIGKKAYCQIVKTRDLHESRVRQYHISRQQLATLKEVRHKLDYIPEPLPNSKRLRTIKREEL